MFTRHLVTACATSAMIAMAVPAAAQSFGIGPRWSFVRSDVDGAPSTKFFGGTMRLGASKRMVFELALDQHTETSPDNTQRLRERPFQGSMLLFLARTRFAPYLLGGFGIYQQTAESLDTTGNVLSSVSVRKTGWHLGAGAELFVTRHTALFGDYRLRSVRWGDADADADEINVPFVSGLKLTHRGSMWTTGVAIYF